MQWQFAMVLFMRLNLKESNLINIRSRISVEQLLFVMKLQSVSVEGKDANQSGVGKRFLIISLSLTVLLNLSIAIWFFMNDMGRFLIR